MRIISKGRFKTDIKDVRLSAACMAEENSDNLFIAVVFIEILSLYSFVNIKHLIKYVKREMKFFPVHFI